MHLSTLKSREALGAVEVYLRVNLGHVELGLGLPPPVVPVLGLHVGRVLIIPKLVYPSIYNGLFSLRDVTSIFKVACYSVLRYLLLTNC